MGLLLIFIGFLFTLNPMIGLIDILPDLIGFIMIFLGINKLGMISPEVTDSAAYFKWGAIISLARLMTFFASGSFDEIMTLCMTMVFAVLEFGVMLLALPLLSDGLSYLNIRYSGSSEEDNTLKTAGTVFFAARGFLSVLPELGALSLDETIDLNVTGEAATFDWSATSSALTLSNILLNTVFAVFFLAVLIKRVWKLNRDGEFVKNLKQAYADKKINDPGTFIRRRLLYAFSILSVGAFFIIDFTADGINYLPDPVFAALSLLAVWLLSPYSEKAKSVYIAGGAYAAFSIASYVYSYLFAKRRFFMMFDTLMVRYPMEYYVGVILAAVESIALVFYVKSMIPLLRDVARTHVGLIVTDEFKRTKQQNEASVKTILKKLIALFVIACVTAASGTAFIGTMHAFPVYWMIHAVLNITLFVMIVNIASNFSSEINMRYEKPGE